MKIFSKDTLYFLQEVHQQNSKEWFGDNKDWYNEALITPLKNFVLFLSETMSGIDGEFELMPGINKTISRINRDTRFSKDKSLYKDRMWVTFKKAGKDKTDYPAYFFEISPYSFRYGMGFFSASSGSMKSLRALMQKKEKQFGKIVSAIEKKGIFQVEGEIYKKNMFCDRPSELQKWYNRKNIYLVYNGENVGELFQEDFMEHIKEDFISLTDLYLFFVEAMTESTQGI
ncbi:MAG TPA: DUF2461 domain-containing protein [Lachnospiraceae bacterium]|nr:DUF2461 domain-containing protein [Lachnospiraceae bacterium]